MNSNVFSYVVSVFSLVLVNYIVDCLADASVESLHSSLKIKIKVDTAFGGLLSLSVM